MQFKFLNYRFDKENLTAFFSYEGPTGVRFTEMVQFSEPPAKDTVNNVGVENENSVNGGVKQFFRTEHEEKILDAALFLCFILIGTSYYKAQPTREVNLEYALDENQARFFNAVYQEGLSQYAYENGLARRDLAHFQVSTDTRGENIALELPDDFSGVLSMQSGGKDSLLTAKILQEGGGKYSFWHLGNTEKYPELLRKLPGELQVGVRTIDMEALKIAGGLNGHVPVTYIVQALAVVQALINHQRAVVVSVGHEGVEPHAVISDEEGDLAINHQWSKTPEAERLFSEYIKRYISPDFEVYSILSKYSELRIAELFAEKCWAEYGHEFSSCNVANYRQGNDDKKLKWCGHCPKCANSYLLFCPFVETEDLNSLFPNGNLFLEPSLTDDFKGLLGVGDVMKPFECVGERVELQKAYSMRLNKNPDSSLPFEVPMAPEEYDFRQVF